MSLWCKVEHVYMSHLDVELSGAAQAIARPRQLVLGDRRVVAHLLELPCAAAAVDALPRLADDRVELRRKVLSVFELCARYAVFHAGAEAMQSSPVYMDCRETASQEASGCVADTEQLGGGAPACAT